MSDKNEKPKKEKPKPKPDPKPQPTKPEKGTAYKGGVIFNESTEKNKGGK